MKLVNIDKSPIVEELRKHFENSEKNEHSVVDAVTADAIERSDEVEKINKENFKEQEKSKEDFVKSTIKDHEKEKEPKNLKLLKEVKVKSRSELGALITEAKQNKNLYKISRYKNEGYRYMFKTYEKLNEDVEVKVEPTTTPNPAEIKPAEVSKVEDSSSIVSEKDRPGFFGLINDLIKRGWDSVDSIKSAIETAKAQANDNATNTTNYDAVIKCFDTILNDYLIHVGMLQRLLEGVDNSTNNAVKQGEDKTDKLLDNNADSEKETEPVEAEATIENDAAPADGDPLPVDDSEVEKEINATRNNLVA